MTSAGFVFLNLANMFTFLSFIFTNITYVRMVNCLWCIFSMLCSWQVDTREFQISNFSWMSGVLFLNAFQLSRVWYLHYVLKEDSNENENVRRRRESRRAENQV